MGLPETNRAVLIRYTRAGQKRRASGLHVGGHFVLTADHCADGSDHRITVDGVEYAAKVHARTRSQKVDLAILEVPTLAAVDPIKCARVNRKKPRTLAGCVALGYPVWKKNDAGDPVLAQVDGEVPTAEGYISSTKPGFLSLKIKNQLLTDHGPPKGELDKPTTPWGGMSGAVLFNEDGLLLGVVRSHAKAEGLASLTVTALDALDTLPGETAAPLWEALGVPGVSALPVLSKTQQEPDLLGAAVARLADEIQLVEKARGLVDPLPLRILFALSPPRGQFNLARERAALLEVAERTFDNSDLGDKLDVRLMEWIDRERVAQIGLHPADDGESSGGSNASPQPLPALSDLDLVIIVVWHDLGELAPMDGRSDLERLADQTREAASIDGDGLPRLLLFKRSDFQLSPWEADASSDMERFDRVKAFFGRLDQDHYLSYSVEAFSALLEWNLRVTLSVLLDHAARVDPDRFGRKAPTTPRDNPFRGLKPYEEKHAARFYGRANEIDELTGQLAGLVESTHLLVVVGASGSGKSSLVRAGLLPRLRLDGLPGSGAWDYLTTLCLSEDSARPMDVVLAHLTEGAFPDSDRAGLRRLLKQDTTGLIEERLADRPSDARVVLFVDQFEELFTLVGDGKRVKFVRFLERALHTPRLVLVVSLRSEFYHRCLEDGLSTDLAERFKRSTYWLTAPRLDALMTMITHPVLFAGGVFENVALPQEILTDMGTASGALPLMSCAMEQLYERCPSGYLTWKAYDELGRVGGIVQKQADAAVAEASALEGESEVQGAMGQVFRSLVGVDDNGVATKKPALASRFADAPPARRLVEALVRRRLLQSDDEHGTSVVSITHEAVLTRWGALSNWITSAQGELLLIRKVERSARDWKEQRELMDSDEARLKTDRELLWPQDRLNEFQNARRFLGITDRELSQEVIAFTRPEFERLVEELAADVPHQRRAEIGERLAVLGDDRPGVGLREDGLPDITWRCIPGGRVSLGIGSDVPPHDFEVNQFFLARYPVTLRQFQVFTTPEVYYKKSWWERLPVDPSEHKPYAQTPEVPNHPALYVSWYQAVAFCEWLGSELGYALRLPTEWEWIQAAIAGHADYNYPWGSDWNPDFGCHREGLNRPISVGMYPRGASPTGVLDLAGNVYEWCLNEFDDLTNVDLSSTKPHTTRGGAYFTMPPGIDVAEQLSVHHRLRDNPEGTRERGQRLAVCIRLACDDPPPERLTN